MTPKDSGYYWIRMREGVAISEWVVAAFAEDGWFLIGTELELDATDVVLIGPRIEPPE